MFSLPSTTERIEKQTKKKPGNSKQSTLSRQREKKKKTERKRRVAYYTPNLVMIGSRREFTMLVTWKPQDQAKNGRRKKYIGIPGVIFKTGQ